MNLKNSVKSFSEKDVYSLILFAIYKSQDVPEYKELSELCFLLDKRNFLRFCEYFGGTTIKVPTIKELEIYLQALQLYECDLKGDKKDSLLNDMSKVRKKQVLECYDKLISVLQEFTYES